MGYRLGIINVGRYLAMILPVIITEHILITFFAGSKNHQLDIIAADIIHNTLDQV